METVIRHKIVESLKSILPIAFIVFALSITLTPMNTGTFLLFLFGVLCLIAGLAVFTMGAEISMQALGSRIGSTLMKSGKLWFITLVSFIIGILITVSEPDLQILASQVSDVPNLVLILTISVGVGLFLVIALLRIVWNVSLSVLLLAFYGIAFILCIFVPADFRAIAFDSGGVTTGPMTVPFIIALGTGVSAARRGNDSQNDSFGLVALCSIGPILSVLILGICYKISGSTYEPTRLIQISETRAGMLHYIDGIGKYALDVATALLPIISFMLLFQLFTRSFSGKQMVRIAVGIVYTFTGLTVFLTGADRGFMPTGYALGESLASIGDGVLLIPVSMLIGYFIVSAEPAVYVLNKQVEQITAGAVSSRTMNISLSVGVAVALGLSMLRILTGISVLWVLIPGYIIALTLTFFTPKIFTGIAFDSGGVASGTMMSAFVLPLAIGASSYLKADIMTQAFGCVALVAMTPIISIQVCGLMYKYKSKQAVRRFVSEEETFIDYCIYDNSEVKL